MKFLENLEHVLIQRKAKLPDRSYTANLFREGPDRILKKIVEEAGEVVLAAKNKDRANLIHEAADLLFHLQVLLVNENVPLAEVVQELEKRHK